MRVDKWIYGVGMSLLWIGLAGSGSSVQAELIITEIMYNPASTPDSSWEYVELFNAGGVAIDLTGYVLDDDGGNPLTSPNLASGIVPAGGLAVLFNGSLSESDFLQAWGATGTLIPVSNWSALNNTGDGVGIWDGLTSYGERDFSTALDSVHYTNSAPWPADDGIASIYLTDWSLDNSVAEHWALSVVGVDGAYESAAVGDNGAINVGSPGVLATVPEPSTAVLLALGAMMLLGCRRGR